MPMPYAMRLPTGFVLENHAAYSQGLIEVQDYGSQLIVVTCAVKPGMTVLDLCAGAGGKTLALAADMAGKRTVDCHRHQSQRGSTNWVRVQSGRARCEVET